jgi:hypothetical protein
VTSEICREVLNIIGKTSHPLMAQSVVEKYCTGIGIQFEEFSDDDLPQFILYIAKERDRFKKIDDKTFFVMLGNLVNFSKKVNKPKESSDDGVKIVQ